MSACGIINNACSDCLGQNCSAVIENPHHLLVPAAGKRVQL